MDMFTFGKRLKETRESKNVSAEVLGEAIGVNKTTIHRYEKGDFKSIKQDRLEAIANFLNVDSDYLIGKSDEKISVETVVSLHKKKNIDINDILRLTTDLLQREGVTLNGKPVDKDTVWNITYAIEISLETAKRKKER